MGHPAGMLVILVLIFVFFAFHARDFKLDASADSLLLEDDMDLKIFRALNDRYGSRDFLFLTFTPATDLFSDSSLANIARLESELEKLSLVDSVVSILNVPLVKQVEGTLGDIAKNYRTLADKNVDRKRARQELLNSPIYSQMVISLDGKTTALQINLKDNPEFRQLLKTKNELITRKHQGTLNEADRKKLSGILEKYEITKAEVNEKNHENIEQIRSIMEGYRQYGTLHLGGVPMITDDMITYIKSDLVVFGVGVFVFLVVMLGIIFRRKRWIILPLISCVYAGLLMIGLLGLVGWQVTVISSNFISLMLISTMAMNIHLIVRYRQLRNDFPGMGQFELVSAMTHKMVWPCLYTALTTIMAFTSLVVSDIKPVIDFGWMMTIGLTVTGGDFSYFISFVSFDFVAFCTNRSYRTGQVWFQVHGYPGKSDRTTWQRGLVPVHPVRNIKYCWCWPARSGKQFYKLFQ